jgi:hypothetical protein
MKIVVEEVEWSPETAWALPNLYDFFNELSGVCLKPASENLTSLTLHSSNYWDYMPKSDFRGRHFPRLKKLKLENYVFTHDWQLD